MPAASSTSNAESKVQAVLQTLRNDPDLHPTEVRRGLRFKHSDTPADPETPRRALGWWHALGLWLSEQGRYLVWLLGMVAVAWLALRLWRYRHGPRLARLTAEPDAPSHVLALDIRPANLPDDIGQAAAALWHAGDARAALSLLYRAALSRLVHGRGVPLRGSSTEGEALALAHGHVDAAALAYLGTLVRLWQALVYAARQPRADEVLPLCQAFELHLSARVQAAAPSA